MKIDGKEINIDKIKQEEKKSFYKRTRSGIMLNDEQREILREYNIDYNKCKNLKELLFKIEECLNSESIDYDTMDLESVSLELSEIYYYNNVNK